MACRARTRLQAGHLPTSSRPLTDACTGHMQRKAARGLSAAQLRPRSPGALGLEPSRGEVLPGGAEGPHSALHSHPALSKTVFLPT